MRFTVLEHDEEAEFAAAAPALAEPVRTRLGAHTHETLASVRRDRPPRSTGTETMLRYGER